VKLTGRQLNQLNEALVAAFDKPDLERMLRVEMDVSLDHVVSADGMNTLVFSLIRWAERFGRVEELIRSAFRSNPNNPELRAFVEQFGPAQPGDPEPTGDAAPVATSKVVAPVSLKQLREVIVANFSESDLQVLCADIQDALMLAGTPLLLNLDIVGGTDKRAKVLNLVEYLKNRQLLPYLVDAGRDARPGLLP
jgi:hypothetical protein